jgi:hypothetical protein
MDTDMNKGINTDIDKVTDINTVMDPDMDMGIEMDVIVSQQYHPMVQYLLTAVSVLYGAALYRAVRYADTDGWSNKIELDFL